MAQLSLYMDDAAMEKLRLDAAESEKSISSFAREVLENRHKSGRGWINGWPPGYFDLFGSSPEFPDVPDPNPDAISPLDAV